MTTEEPSTKSPDLPAGWTWTTLNEVCEKIQDGTHFSPKNQLPEGKYRYVTAKNVRPHGLDLSDISYLTEEDHRSIYERCDARKGDVLLVKDGVNTGDAAINTVEEEISLLSSVCMLRPCDGILNNQYLRYYLLSPRGALSLTGSMTGTAIKRIILRRVKEVAIPIPPLEQQARIVAKLEEVISGLDAGVAALKRAQASLKRYRAAVLKEAVEGTLTEEWRAAHPNTEPASKLLERILAERRRKWEADQLAKFASTGTEPPTGWRSRYVEPAAPDTSGLPRLPETWCWATFLQCAHDITVGHVGPMKHRYVPDGYPFLRSQNVRPLRYDREGLRFIPDDFHKELPKSQLTGGELLVVRSGNIGEACVYPVGEPTANCADLVITRPVNGLLAQYAAIFTVSPLGQAFIGGKKTGSALSHFNVGAMARSVLPLPSKQEQEQIVTEVEERLSVIAATQAQSEANLLRSARLRQSILKEAFAGQLVPQDPADECFAGPH